MNETNIGGATYAKSSVYATTDEAQRDQMIKLLSRLVTTTGGASGLEQQSSTGTGTLTPAFKAKTLSIINEGTGDATLTVAGVQQGDGVVIVPGGQNLIIELSQASITSVDVAGVSGGTLWVTFIA